jgi:uncharacterized protein YjiK
VKLEWFIRIVAPAALWLAALAGSGCATKGPNHVYTATSAKPQVIYDRGPDATTEVPTFMAPGESLTGLAYDPYTDHLFLRLAPGNKVRVVDRPARQIKREFFVGNLPATGGGDLAVRPRDGHIFLVHPTLAALVEINRFGDYVRQVELAGLNGRIAGVAYDPVQERLWVSEDSPQRKLHVYDRSGTHLREFKLNPGGPRGHLAYDSTKREIHVAVLEEALIAVFSEDGILLRQIPAQDGHMTEFLDAGQRSFVRVF